MAKDTTSDQQRTATFEHKYADSQGSNQALEQAQFDVTSQAKLLQKAEMLAELAAWEWDIVNDTWHISPNWCRIHGVSKVPSTFAQRILIAHPQDRERIETASRRALAEGVPYAIEHRIVRQDTGEIRHVKARGDVECCPTSGRPLRMIGICQDVTEQKRVEQAFQVSEAKLRGFFENLRDAVFFHKIQDDGLPGPFLEVNRAACERLGYSAAELKQFDPMTLDVPEVIANVIPQAMTELQVKGHALFESVQIAKDGRRIPVENHTSLIHTHEGQFLLTVCRDISERKKAYDKLSEFSTIVEQTINGVAVADLDGYLTFINRAWLTMHGYQATAQLLGEHLRIFHTDEQLETEVLPDIEQVKQQGHSISEIGHRRRDGTTFPTLMSTTLLNDRQGIPYAIVGIAQDLTKQKQAEQQIAQAKQAAEAANVAKSRFLASMSHEIRTPMNAVTGMTHLLLDTALTPEQRDYANTIRASSQALLGLINDILDLSRIEAGKLTLHTQPFDLRALLDDLFRTLRPLAKAKQLTLTEHLGPAVPPHLQGDPDRLRQILMNLVGNAIKFSPSGGVKVTVDPVVQPIGESCIDDIELRFAVQDTGIGIAKAQQNQLFQPFSQIAIDNKPNGGGTGLGLAIAKQLAELMGGTIGVNSETGQGAEFWFTACFKRASAATAEPTTATAETRLSAHKQTLTETSSKRILIADDDEFNRKVATGMLKKLGYAADAVASGQAALEALQFQSYDLVMMDVEMPIMDGFETTRRLRDPASGVSNPQLPVIALTAHAMGEHKDQCLAAGMDDYLTKPIDPQVLTTTLAAWLPEGLDERPSAAMGLDHNPAEPVPILDRQNLRQRLAEDEELVEEMLEDYRQALPDSLGQLASALTGGNLQRIREQAHRVKSSAGNIGAMALAAFTSELETQARAGTAIDTGTALAELNRLKEALLREMGASKQVRNEEE